MNSDEVGLLWSAAELPWFTPLPRGGDALALLKSGLFLWPPISTPNMHSRWRGNSHREVATEQSDTDEKTI